MAWVERAGGRARGRKVQALLDRGFARCLAMAGEKMKNYCKIYWNWREKKNEKFPLAQNSSLFRRGSSHLSIIILN